MKRVLIFSLNYYPRFIGGAEVAIKEITDRIPAEEIEFHLLSLRFDSELPEEERIGNVVVHRIGKSVPHPSIADLRKPPLDGQKRWYQFGAFFAANRLHRKYRFDGIWAMMAHSAGIPAGLFKTFHPQVKYLLTLQEGDPPEYIEKLARPVWPLFARAFTTADAMQTISTFLYRWGIRRGFSGYSEVIGNGVDIARFSHPYPAEEIDSMKTKLDKKESDVFLITTSRLVEKNAVDDVIRALPMLPEQVAFLIYGIGPDEEKLKKLAKELGVEDRARFMGEIRHQDLPLALSACDIFIRPSRSEGMGISFVEAMATGLPVIATQEGGIADFLFDAKRNPDKSTTGYAVDKDSPEQIAEAVKEILADPAQVARVTQQAEKMVIEQYDWVTIASRMRALFARLLGDTIDR